MVSDQQPADLVEISTAWGPIVLAAGFAAGGAMVCVALTSRMDVTTTVMTAAFGSTQAASFGGLAALWFGAELGRRWSWLFGLSLSWYVALVCLLSGLTLWPALVVGLMTALALGTLLVWRLAGFSRRARGRSFTGVYLAPLLALVGVALVFGREDGLAGAIVLVLTIPLAIPFGGVVGALLGAER